MAADVGGIAVRFNHIPPQPIVSAPSGFASWRAVHDTIESEYHLASANWPPALLSKRLAWLSQLPEPPEGAARHCQDVVFLAVDGVRWDTAQMPFTFDGMPFILSLGFGVEQDENHQPNGVVVGFTCWLGCPNARDDRRISVTLHLDLNHTSSFNVTLSDKRTDCTARRNLNPGLLRAL